MGAGSTPQAPGGPDGEQSPTETVVPRASQWEPLKGWLHPTSEKLIERGVCSNLSTPQTSAAQGTFQGVHVGSRPVVCSVREADTAQVQGGIRAGAAAGWPRVSYSYRSCRAAQGGHCQGKDRQSQKTSGKVVMLHKGVPEELTGQRGGRAMEGGGDDRWEVGPRGSFFYSVCVSVRFRFLQLTCINLVI